MAEEIRAGTTEDLANLPDPALNHKHKVKADIAFVLQEQNIEGGVRLWIKFRKANPRWSSIVRNEQVQYDLYHKKVVLYISQPGKMAIIWMNDNFWKVDRRKKLKPAERYASTSMKIDVHTVNIEESRAQSLKRYISESSVL